jgi:hypothetical protein
LWAIVLENIKIALKERDFEDWKRIELAQDLVYLLALVLTVLNLWVLLPEC